MAKEGTKRLREDFARFFENPSRETLREVLRNNVGEFENLDFKADWPERSALGRHVLGLGNSKGGCLVVGVEDESLSPVGMPNLIDHSKIRPNLEKYVPSQLLRNLDIIDFPFSDSEYPKLQGKQFQVLFVEDDPFHLPFVSIGEGKSIRKNAIYVRQGASTEKATNEELQRLINRRIETGHSSGRELELEGHLHQLKLLYAQIPRYVQTSKFADFAATTAAAIGIESKPNPEYPEERYQAFVKRAIQLKKQRILDFLSVDDGEHEGSGTV